MGGDGQRPRRHLRSCEAHRGPSGYHDEVFHDDDHVVRTLTKLLDDASTAHRKLDPAEGLQDAQLDDGARVHIVHGDIARGGHVLVNIRKFTGIPFRSLGELVERDMLSGQVADFLAACVHARLSIVFAGRPARARPRCCAAPPPSSTRACGWWWPRRCSSRTSPCPTWRRCRPAPPGPTAPAVDLRRLVAGFLRMAPDVAIVGEVRDREALPLLLTLSSGVTGLHDHPRRLGPPGAHPAAVHLPAGRHVGRAAAGGAQLAGVSESIDVVVHCARTPRARGSPRWRWSRTWPAARTPRTSR